MQLRERDMKTRSWFRLLMLFTVSGLSLTALALASAVDGKKSETGFVKSLFAQATADDYVNEQSCVRCHARSHASFDPSPHKGFVGNASLAKDRQGCQSCHGPCKQHVQHSKPGDDI